MEGLMKEIKACTGRCNGDCKKKSKGSLGLEDYCNRMCAVGCLQTVINSRPTMKEKKAEKKAKDELMSENEKCMHNCNTNCDRGASTTKKSCNEGCPKRCPKPTDEQIKKRAEKIIRKEDDGKLNHKIKICTDECNTGCKKGAHGNPKKAEIVTLSARTKLMVIN